MSNNRKLISFIIWIVVMATGLAYLKYYFNDAPKELGVPKISRKVIEFNSEFLSREIDDTSAILTFPYNQAVPARVNGNVGMKEKLDTNNYQLVIILKDGNQSKEFFYNESEINKLPYLEYTFLFKCVEGWSQKTNWGGTKFAHFIKEIETRYRVKLLQYKYVGFETPDKKYYVGIDMPSMLHSQTILCNSLNRKPLPENQGAPLRLIIPIKYGIKSIKRIKYITFTNERPKDYWYERGYDYNSGL